MNSEILKEVEYRGFLIKVIKETSPAVLDHYDKNKIAIPETQYIIYTATEIAMDYKADPDSRVRNYGHLHCWVKYNLNEEKVAELNARGKIDDAIESIENIRRNKG